MKKTLFIIAAGIMMIATAQAQNSTIEAIQQLTKTEQFINSCSFYKTEKLIELKEGGLYVTAMVLTDLQTNKKIGAMYFESKTDGKKMATGVIGTALGVKGSEDTMNDAGPKPLGYLDLDNIDDLISSLNAIVESTKQKSDVPYVISYITKGCINVTYNSESEKVIFSREWNSINRFGTPITGTISSPEVSIKSVVKTIDTLEKAKNIINQNLQ